MDTHDRDSDHAPNDVREEFQKWLDLAALEPTAASADAHRDTSTSPTKNDADESLFSVRHGQLHWTAFYDSRGQLSCDLTPKEPSGCCVPVDWLDEFLDLGEGECCKKNGFAWFYGPPHDQEECFWRAEMENDTLYISVEVGPEVLTRRAAVPRDEGRIMLDYLSIQQGNDSSGGVKKTLEKVAEEISRTAMCCHEAIQGYWERNDEGFEAMRVGLERALRLLGYPPPDYATRDQEWKEENASWRDSDENHEA